MTKKFCIIPWHEGFINTVGTYGLCCKENSDYNPHKVPINQPLDAYWNSDYMRKTRLAFVNGDALPQCQVCWTDEDSGKISMRNRRNQRYLGEPEPAFDSPAVADLLANTGADGHLSRAPRAFNLSVGTVCQLRCIQCSPSYSRSIIKDYQKLGWADSFKTRRDPDTFDITLDQLDMDQHLWPMLQDVADTVEWLQITGGEPTMSRPLLKFLRWCVDQGLARNISVLIATNAVNIKPEFVAVMREFKMCIWHFSVDGYGELDEYIRWPTNWAKKERIIQELMPQFPKSCISMAVGSMNINQFDQMVDWVLQNDYLLNPQIITCPDNLSLRHLPADLKDHARALLQACVERVQKHGPGLDASNLFDKTGYLINGINALSNYLNEPADPAVWQQTVGIVRAYDTIRGRALHEINPWFRGHTD